MLVKLTNITRQTGGGKKSIRWRKRQNITFVFKEDYTNNQIFNIAIKYGYYPTNSTKIIKQ